MTEIEEGGISIRVILEKEGLLWREAVEAGLILSWLPSVLAQEPVTWEPSIPMKGLIHK